MAKKISVNIRSPPKVKLWFVWQEHTIIIYLYKRIKLRDSLERKFVHKVDLVPGHKIKDIENKNMGNTFNFIAKIQGLEKVCLTKLDAKLGREQ